MGYNIIRLKSMLEVLGEESTIEALSSFSCPLNPDVEQFITHKSKAIEFDKQAVARTFVVTSQYKKEDVTVGYFTLTNKDFIVSAKRLSSNMRRRVAKFGVKIPDANAYRISAPLIAQLSKNFYNDYNRLIAGDELIKMALERVEEVQLTLGGKIVYIECEDKQKLIEFYRRHGFVEFSRRPLDSDEKESLDGDSLVQLLRYT